MKNRITSYNVCYTKLLRRGRSPENFVGELEFLRDTYGVNVVMISDETPTLERHRWERILDLLIERNVGTKILMETRVDDILRDEDIMWKYQKADIDHIYRITSYNVCYTKLLRGNQPNHQGQQERPTQAFGQAH